jgi:hypothetical protein
MENDRWQAYVAAAVQELKEKQQRLASEYGIGKFARWRFDQETATLQSWISMPSDAIGRPHRVAVPQSLSRSCRSGR